MNKDKQNQSESMKNNHSFTAEDQSNIYSPTEPEDQESRGYLEEVECACSHCKLSEQYGVGSHGGPVRKCDGECHFQEPYGFVPHAGCPLHDIMTEEERIIFERGFEEGYATAKRNYKISAISYLTEGEISSKKLSPKD